MGQYIRLLTSFRLSAAARYSLCVAAIAAATLIRWYLNPVLGSELPYIVLFFTIVPVAWIGGLGPAVLGVALGVLSVDWFFITPHSFGFVGKHDLVTTGLFAFIGIATGAMSEAYRRALQSSETARLLSLGQQAELQQIYASTPVGLGFLDENLRYLRVNDALATFNGIAAEAHLGRHVRDVVSPQVADEVASLLTQVLATRKPITNIEFQAPLRNGREETRYVRASFYPTQLGELKGIHGVVVDVTAEKKAQEELTTVEAQLRQAVKMEAVGRLAGGVAHDFNNLLMVISSYTEMLQEQLHDQPGQVKKLNAIAEAAQRAARLTKQLLAFSRKQTLQPQVLEMDSLIRNFEHLLRAAIAENIDLQLELNSVAARIKVDPSQFEQCLMSLAVNARDAMPNGGQFAIHTILCHFKADTTHSAFSIPAGEYVEISIRDSGRGMSPEVQSRIFDPFFTTKSPGQGTGLGLAMVYGIVKQSGGYIEVQSAPGEGTAFRIWLPTTTAKELSAESAAPLSAAKGSGTILVAEDEALLRQAIYESLTGFGYCVLEATDGTEALAIIEAHTGNIDLLLSDAVMPRMGGLDLIQRVHAAYPAIKTVLMSGYANPDSQGSSSGEAADANTIFLQKPFAHSELAKVVRRLLPKSQPD